MLDMQEHKGVVTRDQIQQEKFQGLNFDVQDFMGQYAKVLNKLEIENSPWLYLSFGLKIWEGWNMLLWGLNLGLKFWSLNLWGLKFGLNMPNFSLKSLTFSIPFKGTFSLLLATLVLFVLSLTSWAKFYAIEDHSTSFGIRATFKLVLTVVSMLLPQGAIDHSIALGQPSSTNLHILMKNFIHLLTVERGKIISNPPKCFKCNGVGYYASSCLTKRGLIFRKDLNGWIENEEDESGECVEGEENSDGDSRMNNFQEGEDDVNRLDMQEHQGVVIRAKAKQLKSHKDQIEQEKFQGLNFDVQDFMGQYAKVLNKLEIENLPQ
ncbi:hypothetical protein M9H77_36387 [Catharanthus roseus]|uniref:Uncharacterized protein n=1 Tax=Catharanthus roseus TaxID=4058 RepID=A0ACB9ZTV0_CATRO|nr:hypothetical protein M9H77_36387 [Catharanthus roseus]